MNNSSGTKENTYYVDPVPLTPAIFFEQILPIGVDARYISKVIAARTVQQGSFENSNVFTWDTNVPVDEEKGLVRLVEFK